jgi:hypothetical protein
MANPIVFRRNSDIGAPDAEADDLFLSNCFTDTGDLATLLDCQNPRCLVLGRTGSGKTALLKQILRTREHSVELSPEDLALNYVTNSQTLRFFEEAGVQLDIFYTLLWRHIITVELLKLRYNITNSESQTHFLSSLGQLFSRDKTKKKALDYLTKWGSQFWTETEYRTKEFTRKLETDLTASAKVDTSFIHLGAEGARKLSEEQRIEVRDAGMRVVNQVQVKDLHEVIGLLAEDIFYDLSDKYYIVIDRLDEDWVDDRIRFKLIKALIEALRTFRKIHSAKIIVALRTDLHFRVLKETVHAGFQQEKYTSLYLHLRWTRQQLEQLLDRRVNFMFKRQYTNSNVALLDILPSAKIEKRSALDHILDRTFFRPREAILYLNNCIARSEGSNEISITTIRQVDVTYSQRRLISLADEWRREYPNLINAMSFLNRRDIPFTIASIDKDDCEKLALKILEESKGSDSIYDLAEVYYLASDLSEQQFMSSLLAILYQAGVVGVKPDPQLGRQWAYLDEPTINKEQIRDESKIDVHKTFWAALGIARRTKDDEELEA